MSAETSSKGGFFAIDSRVWAKVTACGMNEAVAYLVLACGTGHDNRSTSWSTNSVINHAGVGWIRAKQAIEGLIAGGFIHYATSHTEAFPRYELGTHRELVDHESVISPLAKLDHREEEMISDIQAGRQPSNRTMRMRARSLCLRGLLCRDGQGIYRVLKPVTVDSGDHFVWLPNSIVTGTTSGEHSPVRRLRCAGCIWTLRLFVDLYSAHNLRDDGGVSPQVVRQVFVRQKIGQQGAYTLWGFKHKESTHCWSEPFASHHCRERKAPLDKSPTWQSLDLLKEMGLLSFVPHVFENDTDHAEPIHAYGIGSIGEDPLEFKIGDAANYAARAMALPIRLNSAEEEGFKYFCPVLRTMPSAQMIGVARLTYRPHTRRTAAWFAELHQTAQGWIDAFVELAAKGEKAALRA